MKSFEFTTDQRQFVKQEVAFGATQKDVAKVMGCTIKTLRKHCWRELQDGKGWANRAVAKSLFWSATVGKNVTAGIWWEKTRAGYREPTSSEHAAANAPPPPRLGISFEDGGPGRVRTTPFELPPASAGDLSPNVEKEPAQVLLPAPKVEADSKPPRTTWEKLGLSQQEFLQLPEQRANADAELDAQLRHLRPVRVLM